jgi:hypothetical protein
MVHWHWGRRIIPAWQAAECSGFRNHVVATRSRQRSRKRIAVGSQEFVHTRRRMRRKLSVETLLQVRNPWFGHALDAGGRLPQGVWGHVGLDCDSSARRCKAQLFSTRSDDGVTARRCFDICMVAARDLDGRLKELGLHDGPLRSLISYVGESSPAMLFRARYPQGLAE